VPSTPPATPAVATPVLRVSCQGHELLGSGRAALLVGRGVDAALRVADELVSRHHLRLRPDGDGWTAEDIGSRNGTFLDGRPIGTLRVRGVVRLRLGHPERGPVLELAEQLPDDPPPRAPAGGRRHTGRAWIATLPRTGDPGAPTVPGVPEAVHPLAASALRIGRTPDNDVVLDDPLVSRSHAAVRRGTDGGFHLLDLGSANGTFVNGTRVREPGAGLREGDLILVGRTTFRLAGSALEAFPGGTGARVDVAGLRVRVRGRRAAALDDVGFSLPGGGLLAVAAPSGGSPRLLLEVLAGIAAPARGRVTVGGSTAFVPAGPAALHPALTLERALAAGARVRLPAGAGRAERVESVLAELGLTALRRTRVGRLAPADARRAAVAAALLGEPRLLLVEDPAAGLGPAEARALVRRLAGLAGSRTVVVAGPDALDDCDRLLLLTADGRQAWYGPPERAAAWFDRHAPDGPGAVGDLVDALALLEAEEPSRSALRFRASPEWDRWVAEPLAAVKPPAAPAPPDPPRWTARALAVARRELAVLAARPARLLVLALLAVAAWYLTARVGLPPKAAQAAALVPGLAAGLAATAGERRLLRAERLGGLPASAWLAGRAAVLAPLALALTAPAGLAPAAPAALAVALSALVTGTGSRRGRENPNPQADR
jgi:pSer/pThr/pTyr-binding forkhead associated (FHA) protein/ABC-type multidrug transport system ATPase subunit